MAGRAAQVEETGVLQRSGNRGERRGPSPSEASGAVVNTGPRGEAKQQRRRFFQESKTERENLSTKPPKLKNVTNMHTCPSGQP
jgi:hypothetical protein